MFAYVLQQFVIYDHFAGLCIHINVSYLPYLAPRRRGQNDWYPPIDSVRQKQGRRTPVTACYRHRTGTLCTRQRRSRY